MTTTRMLSTAICATLIELTSTVQAQPAPAASMPMASNAMPKDCAKPMARHDHGAEKGTPSAKTMSANCAQAAAATMPADAASTPKQKPIHNHSKVHKTM